MKKNQEEKTLNISSETETSWSSLAIHTISTVSFLQGRAAGGLSTECGPGIS